jgi:hypothetical protein
MPPVWRSRLRSGHGSPYRRLGFRPLPARFVFALAGIVVVYLALVETGKYWYYRLYHAPATPGPRHRRRGYRVHRRAGRFTARTLHPSDRPDPDQANRKRPEPASATGVPGGAPGAPWTASTGPLPLSPENAPAVH